MTTNGSKGDDKDSLLEPSNKLGVTQDDLARHQKTIDIVNARDAGTHTPSSKNEEDQGLSGEDLVKMVKKKHI